MIRPNHKIPSRAEIKVGRQVWGLEKRNYASGELTAGVVKRILTSKPHHPRGIKVMLEDGTVVRVQTLTPPGTKSASRPAAGQGAPIDLDAEGELR